MTVLELVECARGPGQGSVGQGMAGSARQISDMAPLTLGVIALSNRPVDWPSRLWVSHGKRARGVAVRVRAGVAAARTRGADGVERPRDGILGGWTQRRRAATLTVCDTSHGRVISGFALRQLRERSGMTQSELAVAARVGRKWLSQVENGKSTAEMGLVLRLVHVLGREVELVAVPAPVDLRSMVDVVLGSQRRCDLMFL